MKISVVGATGTIGTELADTLSKTQGIELRLTTSRPESVADLEAEHPTAEVIVADIFSVESLTEVIKASDRVMLITPDLSDENQACLNISAAAESAGGLERLVKLVTFPPGMARDDVRPEDRGFAIGYNQGLIAMDVLQRQALPVVYLNVISTFMSNILWCARQISEQSRFVMPSPQVSTWIHPRDVAESCAALLLDKAPIDPGAVFHVSGGEMLSFDDIADTLSKVLGFPVSYSDSNELLEEMFGEDSDLFVRYFESEERYYAGVLPTDTFRQLTGRQPRSLAQWISENRSFFMATGLLEQTI
jgi:NAD(P)H dehydrogenase (quinone)